MKAMVVQVGNTPDDTIVVFKNPGQSEYQALRNMYFSEYFHSPKPGSPYTRSTFDEDGNTYIWLFDTLHYHVVPALEAAIGKKTDQNWFNGRPQ